MIQRNWKKLDLLAFLLVISAAAFWLRYLNFPFQSGDYTFFLSKWYAEIQAAGGFRAIGNVVGNYTPPYMYLMALMTYLPMPDISAIKIFSVLFDYILAVFVGLIVRRISSSDLTALIAYTATLFLPNVFINSAVWGQCDSIYVTFLLMSLYFMMKGKGVASMVGFGLAFAFKLQAIFFLPVVILAVLKKKIQWWSPAVAVLVWFLSGLPAVFAGMRFSDAYGVYFLQASQYPQLTLSAPNLYLWISRIPESGSALGSSLVWFAFGAVGCAMLPLYKKSFRTNDDRFWLLLAAFFAAYMPYVMPHMHERYWYLSDILALTLLVCQPKRWYVSLAVILPSLYANCIYLFGNDSTNLPFFALILLSGICLMGLQLREFAVPAEQTA